MKEFPRDVLKDVFLYCLENDQSQKRFNITRLSMYRQLAEVFQTIERKFELGISISGSLQLANALNFEIAKVVHANYPEHDCSSLDFQESAFDVYLSDQVLEHVKGHPQRVFSECHRVLKPGGIGIVTTCMLNPIHGHPSDFWRFTEEGLKFLVSDLDFELLCSGAWGNRLVWPYINLGLRMNPVPENRNNPVYKIATVNEVDVPVVTWVAFRKSQE